MPIYGYICKSCEHTLDALQKISDDPLVYCPDCGEPQLKRQLSAPRFRLKGKGWYETDFKTKNQRNLHGDKDTSKKADKPDTGKSGKDASTSKSKSAPAAGD
jgi:putative FmdB family regulatory protein